MPLVFFSFPSLCSSILYNISFYYLSLCHRGKSHSCYFYSISTSRSILSDQLIEDFGCITLTIFSWKFWQNGLLYILCAFVVVWQLSHIRQILVWWHLLILIWSGVRLGNSFTHYIFVPALIQMHERKDNHPFCQNIHPQVAQGASNCSIRCCPITL